ncbi:bacillithiol system redox-active protein YtxJ [Chitinophaga sedimenti]|uniref:bacillithiol system redox-active protein YtxJ n=1 Tax=Chitinophaga sedimenti TaxID=2033606 RepID=UPI002002E24E|nr:bacillithiol system redox-active protein YtxJ [Chitinophaga sedimenti]MCK7556644.1 bacillithiol system redox-active protein YtxJ [Chitinophaga sedimenti]
MSMNWMDLSQEEQLSKIQSDSFLRPVVIFKHSTRCSISSMAKSRLERATPPQGMDFYYLDLIRFRSLSDRIAGLFNVRHESPQVLVVKDGKCVYDESHMGISMEQIAARA